MLNRDVRYYIPGGAGAAEGVSGRNTRTCLSLARKSTQDHYSNNYLLVGGSDSTTESVGAEGTWNALFPVQRSTVSQPFRGSPDGAGPPPQQRCQRSRAQARPASVLQPIQRPLLETMRRPTALRDIAQFGFLALRPEGAPRRFDRLAAGANPARPAVIGVGCLSTLVWRRRCQAGGACLSPAGLCVCPAQVARRRPPPRPTPSSVQ